MSLQSKQRIKFVTLTRGTKMAFEDRLVYSVLLARKHGLTKAGLSKLSGVDRTRTLPSILTRLGDGGLIVKRTNRYFGQPSDIVVTYPGPETWYEGICYLKYYLPSTACPLSKKQLAVYYLKRDGKDSTSLMARLLNITRPTVINAVKVLKQHGLLDDLGQPVPVPTEKLLWWLDKAKKAVDLCGDLENLADNLIPLITHFSQHKTEWIAVHPWKAEFTRFGRLCKEAGYSYRKVIDLIEKTVDRLDRKSYYFARVFKELPKLVQKAEDQTKKNRCQNNFRGTSSYGLFVCKLNDLVKHERKNLVKK